MTEDEAKTKWCPQVRVMWHQQGGGANAWMTKTPDDKPTECIRIPDEACCIGSACMMWRTISGHDPDFQGSADIGKEPSVVIGGYCGIAGKP